MATTTSLDPSLSHKHTVSLSLARWRMAMARRGGVDKGPAPCYGTPRMHVRPQRFVARPGYETRPGRTRESTQRRGARLGAHTAPLTWKARHGSPQPHPPVAGARAVIRGELKPPSANLAVKTSNSTLSTRPVASSSSRLSGKGLRVSCRGRAKEAGRTRGEQPSAHRPWEGLLDLGCI